MKMGTNFFLTHILLQIPHFVFFFMQLIASNEQSYKDDTK